MIKIFKVEGSNKKYYFCSILEDKIREYIYMIFYIQMFFFFGLN